MSIENNGFLGNDINQFIQTINEKYKLSFDYCRDLNQFSQKLLYQFNIRNKMLNELLIDAAYTRLLSSFQGSILMAERGMLNEMRVLSRNMSEMVFLIGAISNNSNNAKLFLLDDEIQRKKLLNKYSSLNQEYQNIQMLPEVQKVIEEIKSNISDQDIKHFSTECLSIEANLHDHYKTYYAILSLSVHPSAREFQNIFTVENEDIKSINYGPSDEDIEKIILSNCSYILITINNVKKVFLLNIDDELNTINNRFIEVWKSKFK